MTTFQFYKKQNALVHINVENHSFNNENEKLIAQGFESIGEIVQAETSYAAFSKFKELHYKKRFKFTNSHLFINNSLV
jgi:hypothetical protein